MSVRKRITVIVLEEGVRRELEFRNIDGDMMQYSKGTLLLPVYKSLLGEMWVVPQVSHYCVQGELQWPGDPE